MMTSNGQERKRRPDDVLARAVFQCRGRPNAAAIFLCDLGERFLPMGLIPPGGGKKDALRKGRLFALSLLSTRPLVEGTSAGDW